jgi:hypothetical protein
MFLPNVGVCLQEHTALQSRSSLSSSPPSVAQISLRKGFGGIKLGYIIVVVVVVVVVAAVVVVVVAVVVVVVVRVCLIWIRQ